MGPPGPLSDLLSVTRNTQVLAGILFPDRGRVTGPKVSAESRKIRTVEVCHSCLDARILLQRRVNKHQAWDHKMASHLHGSN